MKFKKKDLIIKFKKNLLICTGPLGNLEIPLASKYKYVKQNTYFLKKKDLFTFKEIIQRSLHSVSNGWFFELYIKGKGFKLFTYKDYLAFDLGYSNLFLFKNKLKSIKVLNIKQKIIAFSTNKNDVSNLIATLKNFYFKDQYQGRGLFFKDEKIELKKVKKI